MSIITHQVVQSGLRLDKYLAQHQICTSRSEAAKWIDDALVTVNGEVAKASYLVQVGDHLQIQKPEIKLLDLTPKKIDFEIYFEDKDILVLNKPAGISVHPGAGDYDETLVHGLLHHCKDLSGIGGTARPGIVHRLDKGTTGVMVIAKNDHAHQDLSEQFKNHTVFKEYQALVIGSVQKQQQTLVDLMKRSEFNRKKFVVNQKKGKEAVTHVTVISKNDRATHVSVKIDTGRTHQIRVHLSHIGHAIMGDETYGGTKKLSQYDEEEKQFIRDLKRPLLHSHKLVITHPRSKKKMEFISKLPDDFQNALKRFLNE